MVLSFNLLVKHAKSYIFQESKSEFIPVDHCWLIDNVNQNMRVLLVLSSVLKIIDQLFLALVFWAPLFVHLLKRQKLALFRPEDNFVNTLSFKLAKSFAQLLWGFYRFLIFLNDLIYEFVICLSKVNLFWSLKCLNSPSHFPFVIHEHLAESLIKVVHRLILRVFVLGMNRKPIRQEVEKFLLLLNQILYSFFL